MYGQVWWPILWICALHLTHPSAHTHSSEHTHTVNTHPEQWAAVYAAAPGVQLGVRCLAQGHLSRGIEGGESSGYSLPPPTITAGPETRTRDLRLQVRLYIHYTTTAPFYYIKIYYFFTRVATCLFIKWIPVFKEIITYWRNDVTDKKSHL